MTTTVKITALTDIGANLAGTTLVPVVNMAGTPTTQRANVNNIANYVLNKATGANLGPVANVIITGGTASQVLTTNGSNVLSWTTVPVGANISNGNSNVRIATSNGNVTIAVVGNTTMTITGTGANITGTANISSNANVGNLGTGGLIVATGNVTGGNVLTAGIVKTGTFVTGNIPAAATVGVGARAFVTDATLATFGSAYVGGAANSVPVWSNGTAWYIG
jgi:hypothetical protein